MSLIDSITSRSGLNRRAPGGGVSPARARPQQRDAMVAQRGLEQRRDRPPWTVLGDLGAAATLTSGRLPGPGEAIVAESAAGLLGLDGPAGYVAWGAQEAAVVGTFTAREPFGQLDNGVLIGSPAGALAPASTMYVVIGNPDDVGTTQAQVLQLVDAPSPTDLQVQPPAELAELQSQVREDVGAFGRSLLLLVLAAGAALTGIVVLSDVLLRRTDLGRRRALGATRSTLIALVTLRTTIASTAGSILGAVLGVLLAIWTGSLALWSLVVGALVLAVLTATHSSSRPGRRSRHA
ncbi:ABC transporter permease [Blastococcus sp. HT6-30]|uniref:ABC transporter permease n=1 Tax=Blastococcus sp. HT6-30 TaxID=3144843 RepID=UPI00321A2538